MEYVGHGNSGLVTRVCGTNKFFKFIPCVSFNDCVALAGFEGLCTSAVASTGINVFPKRNRCEILDPDEFKKKWLKQIKKFPFPKRWGPRSSWTSFDWHVLTIQSSEFLHPIRSFLPKSQEEFDYVATSLFKAIQQIQESFQMVHGDMHVDNIMIRLTPGQSVKDFLFRIDDNRVLKKTFHGFEYDVVVVDWEKAISPKLFGWKSTHAHLQRMIPLFHKHGMNAVPAAFIDLEMLRVETLPFLSKGKFEVPKLDSFLLGVADNYVYDTGFFPVEFLKIPDPKWMTLKLFHESDSDSDSVVEVFPPRVFDDDLLPKWPSEDDFLRNFEKEYFLYQRPMHQYRLPPFDWEKKQFAELCREIKDEYGVDIRRWPTSIPRPIVAGNIAQKVIQRQKEVIISKLKEGLSDIEIA